MKSPARPVEPTPMQNPLFEAFGQMIVEAANREANLRAQLIEAQRCIAKLNELVSQPQSVPKDS